MTLLTVSRLLTWLSVGSLIAILVISTVWLRGGSLFGGNYPRQRENRMTVAMFIAFSLFLSAAMFAHTVNLKLQCPNCEKAVSSNHCPDCGWEIVVNPVPTCPTCGSEWDTPFCGDCGSSMDLDT